jgi:predicted nucleic acid-binding protein
MALTHLLDTSVFCQPIKPTPLSSVQSRWTALGDEALAVSVICEAELLYGLELRGSTKLAAQYEHLLKNRLASLPVDASVAVAFARLKSWAKRKGHSASDFDFLIAATAKAHGLVLATLNYRHFQWIEGLAVEDWTKD